MTPRPEPVLFEAVCTPPSSFTRRGYRVLVGVAAAGAVLPAAVALSWGAWPVMGFLGLELLLVLAAIAFHARRNARVREILLLEGGALRIHRTDARGRREDHSLDPYWLRVQLQEDPAGPTRLLLMQRRLAIEVGRSLGAEDKRSLADALRAALARYRNPVFDNPQLRDGAPRA